MHGGDHVAWLVRLPPLEEFSSQGANFWVEHVHYPTQPSLGRRLMHPENHKAHCPTSSTTAASFGNVPYLHFRPSLSSPLSLIKWKSHITVFVERHEQDHFQKSWRPRSLNGPFHLVFCHIGICYHISPYSPTCEENICLSVFGWEVLEAA